MIVSTLIIVVSTVLFLYWFRYTCVLILNTKTTQDFSEEVATANQLCFADVQNQLDTPAGVALAELQSSLERDYRVVNDLLKKAGDIEVGGDSLEAIMLRIDFRIMTAWFAVSRHVSDSTARNALGEMTQVVAYLANSCGERAADAVQS